MNSPAVPDRCRGDRRDVVLRRISNGRGLVLPCSAVCCGRCGGLASSPSSQRIDLDTAGCGIWGMSSLRHDYRQREHFYGRARCGIRPYRERPALAGPARSAWHPYSSPNCGDSRRRTTRPHRDRPPARDTAPTRVLRVGVIGLDRHARARQDAKGDVYRFYDIIRTDTIARRDFHVSRRHEGR